MNNQKIILVVDDDEGITKPLGRLIRRLLKKKKLDEQYIPRVENDPRKALTSLQESREELALVIADIMMEGMNGLELLERLKEIHPLAPRIILTGYGDKKDAIKAINELKLFYYLEKPWDNHWVEKLVINGLGQHRTAKMETIFKKYVPFEVIAEFMDRSDQTILEGKTLEATVLFLDIIDFTKRTELMDAGDLVKLLNEYFTEMVKVIHQQGGILDKFTGDGLMALFGVPTATDASHDAQNAINAALGIIERVSALNKQRETTGSTPIRIRIGLDTGLVVAGNIGSTDRVNYTAIGDAANTAARIENEARNFINGETGCVLISQNTYNQVQDRFDDQVIFKELGPVLLRGKEKEVPLYKVIA